MLKFLQKFIKNKETKEIKETNFNISLKTIKQIIAKSDFDLAIKWLHEIENKEIQLYEQTSKNSENTKKFIHRKKQIQEIMDYISLKKEKNAIESIIKEINLSFINADLNSIIKLLLSLKVDFLNKKSKVKWLDKVYKNFLEKANKLKQELSTDIVNTFDDFLKKIDVFISLGKIEEAEKWLEEIKYKETKYFNSIKNDHTIIRKKVKKIESEYNLKISKIDKVLHKIYILRNKDILKRKQKEKEDLFINIKLDLENLLKKQEYIGAKTLIETNIKKHEDIKLITFLSKKQKEITQKIKIQAKSSAKNQDIIQEAKSLLSTVWEKSWDNYVNVDNEINTNYFLFLKWKIMGYIKKYLSILSKNSHLKAVNELNYILWNESKVDVLKLQDVSNTFHEWMTKILEWTNISGYDFYGKIIWADKITGDTFILEEKNDKYWFSLWDATWHGLRAGLTVSSYTKAFIDNAKNYDKIEYFAMELNNKLKWSLKSWNFITNILFEINKNSYADLKAVWMWHEPIFIYRKKENRVEEKRLFWLAAGIRNIAKVESIKINDITMNEGDIVISYTDGIIEAKSTDGLSMYWFERFKQKFYEIASKSNNVKTIYDFLIQDLRDFSGKINYDDDVTIILFMRNSNRDNIDKVQIENIVKNLNLNTHININQLKDGKTKEEILKDIENLRMKTELNVILWKLEDLYKNGEILKLKEECIKYVKLWYVSSKINFYLKKAIAWENTYKINIKNKKVQAKYETLYSLYKKWDYKNVIKEAYDVVVKNGNI